MHLPTQTNPDIGAETIERYKTNFFAAYKAPFGIQRIGRNWTTNWNPGQYLTDQKVRSHLEGKYWVGEAGRCFTKTVTVDLDDHGESGPSVYDRANAVMKALPEADPLAFSTPGGGMHLTYFLPEASFTTSARSYVEDQLKAADVEMRPGLCEVYPRENHVLRAPLGHDCYLLDTYMMEPIGGRQESIRQLDEILRWDKLDRLEVPGGYRPTRDPAVNGSTLGPSPFMRQIDTWLTHGLQEKGTRNDAMLKLRWYWMGVEGLDGDEATEKLWEWISTKHNGKSNDYLQNPAGVHRHIDVIVKSFDASEMRGRGSGGVSPEEARKFVSDMALTDREKNLLAHFIVYAFNRARSFDDGIEIQLPSRTLKTWDWRYGEALRGLIGKGHVKKGRGYHVGVRAQTYHVMTYPERFLKG